MPDMFDGLADFEIDEDAIRQAHAVEAASLNWIWSWMHDPFFPHLRDEMEVQACKI